MKIFAIYVSASDDEPFVRVMADDPEQAMERAGANGWAGPQLTSTAYAERVIEVMEEI